MSKILTAALAALTLTTASLALVSDASAKPHGMHHSHFRSHFGSHSNFHHRYHGHWRHGYRRYGSGGGCGSYVWSRKGWVFVTCDDDDDDE